MHSHPVIRFSAQIDYWFMVLSLLLCDVFVHLNSQKLENRTAAKNALKHKIDLESPVPLHQVIFTHSCNISCAMSSFQWPERLQRLDVLFAESHGCPTRLELLQPLCFIPPSLLDALSDLWDQIFYWHLPDISLFSYQLYLDHGQFGAAHIILKSATYLTWPPAPLYIILILLIMIIWTFGTYAGM